MRRYPATTITRIHGCYSILMYGQSCYFFVMENLFYGQCLGWGQAQGQGWC